MSQEIISIQPLQTSPHAYTTAAIRSLPFSKPLETVATKASIGILHSHGPLPIHLRSEGKELSCSLLVLGIGNGTLPLAGSPLLDAAEGKDYHGGH